MRNHFRVALRAFAKSPLVAALSVLSIALGIGLTTGVFSLADALYLRPLPLNRPGELLTANSLGDDGAVFMYGWPDYEDMRQSGGAIAGIAAYQRRGGMLANGDGGTNEVGVSPATPNYFSLLGVKAALGAASLEAARDDRPAAVIGWKLWQRRFGGDPLIVGKTILLGGHALQVSGVLPEGFTGLARGVVNDVWVSTGTWFDVMDRGSRRNRDDQFEIVLRLAPGANPQAVAAQLDASIRGAGKRKAAPAGVRGTFLEGHFAPGWKAGLIVGGGLLALLALILFVACANVAQLQLAQAEGRRKEICMRAALGASGRRIAGELLLEIGVLAFAGSALGVLLSFLLVSKAPFFLPMGDVLADSGVRLDGRALIFALAATVFSVLVSGIPATRLASGVSLSDLIKAGQDSPRSGWRQTLLIIGQTAVSVALLGTTLLFLQSLRYVSAIRPGFDLGKRFAAVNAVPALRIPQAAWCEQVRERLASLPGARDATYARRLPLSGSGGGASVRIKMTGQQPRSVGFNNVAGNYFAMQGTRILTGRGIDEKDRPATQPVIVVSESFARRVLPGRNPVGESIRIDGRLWQVVGVAEDAPSNYLHEPAEPFVYFAFAQKPGGDITLIVEAANDPATLTHAMSRAVKQFDPGATLYGATTSRQHMDAALGPDRLLAALTSALGLFSVVLMAAGLFGVLQYGVARRTRELGVRAALGASPATIHRLILLGALRVVAWGVPLGLAFLAGLASLARSAVIGFSPLDPALYAGSALAVLIFTLLAAWLPALRATRVQPVDALRAD